MCKINAHIKSRTFHGELKPQSAIGREIIERLPLYSKFNTWGDELYFRVSLSSPFDEDVLVVNIGDIAYSRIWKSLCIFYGATPLSRDQLIVPNGPVQVIGHIHDPAALKNLLSSPIKNHRRRICNRLCFLRLFTEDIIIEKSDGGK